MDASPIAAAKSALNVSNLVKLIVGFVVINALLELTGFSSFIYQPIASFKQKFNIGQ